MQKLLDLTIIISNILLINCVVYGLNYSYAVVTYDNSLISGEPNIFFKLPNEDWILTSISFEGDNTGSNYTYILNSQSEFQEIRIIPDVLNLSKDLDTKGFEELTHIMAVLIAKNNDYQIYGQSFESTRVNYTINNNTAYSYLTTGTDYDSNQIFQRIFIGLTSDNTIFAITYSDSISNFNSPESQGTMNNFIKSLTENADFNKT
ncbi:MAG: hypothetical protein L0H53_15230 [Candidatus Nitrosocosmicus sp.]|nr:hypothetical protein [Candidatus Nitrosocosmicus sp.]